LRNETLAQQKLNVTVIPAPGNDLTMAEVIEPAVAHMGPPGGVLLSNTNRACGPRTLFDSKMRAELHDLLMRTSQS
jgi:hypothetical protein